MDVGVFKRLIKDTLEAARSVGTKKVAQLYASTIQDMSFDRKTKLNTQESLDPRLVMADVPNLEGAHIYVPTRAKPFRELLRQSHVPTDGAFVDFGCGRGRAMILAAEYGFKCVRGIEFCDELCESARQNLAQVSSSYPDTDFQVIHADMTTYSLKPDDQVLYFYNPCEEDILAKVLLNIEESLIKDPRTLTIIYQKNVGLEDIRFNKSPLLQCSLEKCISGNQFYIYHSRLTH